MSIETSAWTNPRTGEVRHYINGIIEEALKIEITRYKTGNISSASIMGKGISNSKARGFNGMKLWASEDGTLHLDYFYGADVVTSEEALEIIKAYIKENGGLDFLEEAEEAPAVEEVEEAQTVSADNIILVACEDLNNAETKDLDRVHSEVHARLEAAGLEALQAATIEFIDKDDRATVERLEKADLRGTRASYLAGFLDQYFLQPRFAYQAWDEFELNDILSRVQK